MKKIYNVILIDDYDIDIEAYRVYADDIIVTLIFQNGLVDYNYNDAKECSNLNETINDFIKKHHLNEKKYQESLEY